MVSVNAAPLPPEGVEPREPGRPDESGPGHAEETVSRPHPVDSTRPPLRFVGLPAVSVAVMSLLLTCVGAVVDALTSRSLGNGFTVGFVLACLAGAALVRRSDLVWAVILPPLVFATSLVLTAPVVPGGSGGGFKDQALELGTALSLETTPLVGGTAAAAAIVLVRLVRGRLSGGRARP